jgi:anti-sigma factor RsiW
MRCPSILDWLADREAGRLSNRRQAELVEHLRACPDCQAAEARWQASLTDLRTAFTTQKLPDLQAAVLARVRAQAERPRTWHWAPALWAGAAALTLAIAAPYVLWQGSRLSDPEVLQACADDLNEVSAASIETAVWSVDENAVPYGYIPDAQLQF